MRTLILLLLSGAAAPLLAQPTARSALSELDRNAFRGRPTIVIVGGGRGLVAGAVFSRMRQVPIEGNDRRWADRVSVRLAVEDQGEREFPLLLERLRLVRDQLPAAVAVDWDGTQRALRSPISATPRLKRQPDVDALVELRFALGRRARPLKEATAEQRRDALERADALLEAEDVKGAIKLWRVVTSQPKPHFEAARRASKQLDKQARAVEVELKAAVNLDADAEFEAKLKALARTYAELPSWRQAKAQAKRARELWQLEDAAEQKIEAGDLAAGRRLLKKLLDLAGKDHKMTPRIQRRLAELER